MGESRLHMRSTFRVLSVMFLLLPSFANQVVAQTSASQPQGRENEGNTEIDAPTVSSASIADSFDFPFPNPERIIGYNVHPSISGPSCFGVDWGQLWHAGEDRFAPEGTEVKAVANGVVRFARDQSYPGAVVIIEHTLANQGKVYSVYAHLRTDLPVTEGQSVSKGTPIGRIIAQYHQGQPNFHLHWEIRNFYDGSSFCNEGQIPGQGYTFPERPDSRGYTNPAAFVNSHRGNNVGEIGGIVRSSPNGPEIAGATVKIVSGSFVQTTTTNSAGGYTFPAVPAGTAIITAVKGRVGGSITATVRPFVSQRAPDIVLNMCVQGEPQEQSNPSRSDGTCSTPTPGPSVDNALFLGDVNYPDGSTVSPGQSLTKIWRMKNTGTSTWGPGYQLVFRSGHQLGAPALVNVPATAPGRTVDIQVPLQIPGNLGGGTYRGDWQLRNPQGTYFGDPVWYSLVVPGSQPPSGNGVNVELDSISSPGQVTPGQRFQPEVKVRVTSGQLLQSRGDMLRFYGGANYTNPEFPHVAVQGTVNSGNIFTFRFYDNNPFQAPNTAGTYESKWRVWANNGWVGPEIIIRFNVFTAGGGRPPNKPTLTNPSNWAVLVGQQPTLCAQHNGDPDGDAITSYRFVIYDSAQNYDSGWVSSSCVNPPTLGNYGYKWHAKVRDNRSQESDWSEDRYFNIESTTVTVTDYHFEPASPSTAETVVVRAATSGCGGIGVHLRVLVNTANDGSTNGEWIRIGELGVPQFNDKDAPRWQTLNYHDGTHIIRLEVTSCDNSKQIEDRAYTLQHRKPGVAYPLSPPCYQPWPGGGCNLSIPTTKFWSNSRTVTFSWQPALRASNYNLVVGTTPDPDRSAILNTVVNGTSYTATFDQDYPTLYWKVWANNELGSKDNDRWWLGIDRTAPSSAVVSGAMPPVSYDTQFPVVWSSNDNADGSGVQSYDVQFRVEPSGAWTNWLTNYPYTSAIFNGQPGYTYSFRTRARDLAENIEAYPSTFDAQVRVDPAQRPPQAWWDQSYEHKRQIVVANRMSDKSLPAGSVVQLHFDSSTSPTAAEIYNASITSTKGNDVRVVFDDRSEVPRFITSFSPSVIDLWFNTQADVGASGSSQAYSLYYGNSQAGDPGYTLQSIFHPTNDSDTRLLMYFDEGSGSAVTDLSGKGNNGSLQGSFAQPWPAGRVRTGLNFNGSSLVRVENSSTLNINGPMTIEAWVRPSLIDNHTRNIVSKLSPTGGSSYRLFLRQGQPLFDVEADQHQGRAIGPTPLIANRWYHLAGVYDGNTVRMYVNGVEVASASHTQGVRSSTAWVAIGSTGYQEEYFVGDIDQVRISSVARSSFAYGRVSTDPTAAASQELSQENIGPSDLVLQSLEALPNPGSEGGALLQAVFKNEGQYPTYNEFYTHLYTDHVPSGPGDLTGSISFWVNAPVQPGSSVTLTSVLSNTALLNGLSTSANTGVRPSTIKQVAGSITERTYNFAAQIDSTGSTNDSSRSNNIISGPQLCTATSDIYEPDNQSVQASVISLGQSQVHNTDKAGDADWLKFQAVAGLTYVLRTSDLATAADTYLYLYAEDGSTLLASNDDYDGTLASRIEWTAPSSGTYYLLVIHWNPNAQGCGQSYTVKLENYAESMCGVFTDVPADNAFLPFITCMACKSIIGGYPCGGPGEPCNGSNDPYFRPGVNVTRGQISKMVALAASLTEPAGEQRFEDVPANNPFFLWIQQLSNKGHISGYACGGPGEPCNSDNLPYFRPSNNTTRGQLTKIVSNAAGFSDTPGAQGFADVPTDAPFFEWVQRLSSRGVISGYRCGGTNPATGAVEPCDDQSRPYFRVNNNVTRGQTAKIVSETFFPECQTSARK